MGVQTVFQVNAERAAFSKPRLSSRRTGQATLWKGVHVKSVREFKTY